MNSKVAELIQRIRQLEEELEMELAAAQGRFRFYIERHRVLFDAEAVAAQRKLKKGVLALLRGAELRDLLAGPVTYLMIVPLVLLDLFLFIYQHVAFRLYGIARVRRADFVVIDRQHLAYLNAFEKLNCIYCGYASGLLSYAKVIAGRTEQFWCPIKHAHRIHTPHTRYSRFFDYGDAEAYRNELERIRSELREKKTEPHP